MSRNAWADVDWSKKTTAIAKQRGVSISTVSKARGRYAPETLAAYSGRAATAPTTDLAARLKDATSRSASLERENEHLRKQLTIAKRAFSTTEALMRDVLAERDAALAQLAATRPTPAGPRRPRAPATDRALATALERHPELARALAGDLTDAWHNPGSASGTDGTHNHP